MKKIIFYINFCFYVNLTCYSQLVGVNTINPAVLFDVQADAEAAPSAHGITFPVLNVSPSNMTTAQNGMMTYFKSSGENNEIFSLGEGFYFYYGSRFYPIVSSNNIDTNLNATYLESVAGTGGVNTLHSIPSLSGSQNGIYTTYYKMNLLLKQSYDPGIIVQNYSNGNIVYSSVKINSTGRYNIIINSNISKKAVIASEGGGTSTLTLELVNNGTILARSGVNGPTVGNNKRVLSANMNFITDLVTGDHLYLRLKVVAGNNSSNYNLEYPIGFTLVKLN